MMFHVKQWFTRKPDPEMAELKRRLEVMEELLRLAPRSTDGISMSDFLRRHKDWGSAIDHLLGPSPCHK